MNGEKPGFSKREQQIMEALYVHEEGTVAEIRNRIADPPSLNALRTMIQLLEEKGHLQRRKMGREFIYEPKTSKAKAGKDALGKVLSTFFKGSLEDALAAHFGDQSAKVDDETLTRIEELIAEARKREAGA